MSRLPGLWLPGRYRAAHAQRAERWLGKDCLAQILHGSEDLRIPVPIVNGDGLYAYCGDLIGSIRGGGFTSLSDLISEATTGGKIQKLLYNKVGVTGAVGVANTLWFEGTVPAAGAAGAALAGGTDCTRTTTGALGPQTNATGGDTLHLTTMTGLATVAPNTLLLYDRIWHGVPLLNTTSGQTITHTLLRYAAAATAPGNFMFIEVTTALAATAHNWTVVYVDQDGNTGATTGAVAGVASAIAKRLDHAGINLPLAAGDSGFQDLTTITLSATLASGAVNLVCGHPLGFIPCPVANAMVVIDGINSAFNLVRIYDDACLALLEIYKSATTATTYVGDLTAVSG